MGSWLFMAVPPRGKGVLAMIIAILGGEFSAFLPGTFQNVSMSKWWRPLSSTASLA
jgi:hypothetical protein